MQAFTQMEGLEPAARDIARRTLAHQLEQLAAARTMGVPIALGTDAGSPGVAHGAGVIDELGLLMAAGFSLSQAIAIGTSRAARLLDLNNSGALRPQQEANFVAVAGPPTGLPQALINQPRLYIRGEPWPREQSRSTPYR
jgi:imidazolonepropionase-like amidohydrolase